MITIDELKVQLADYGKAVKDLEEALWPSMPPASACRNWSTPCAAPAFMMMQT